VLEQQLQWLSGYAGRIARRADQADAARMQQAGEVSGQ
jgi:hypothetical protein